ncbi:MAG: winged helix-turn-helix transcriptional regulator [Candidatus Micrarchaeota archaeon]
MDKMGKLDKKDREILVLLDGNGRIPFSRIGKKVHLSKASVALRVAKMQDGGIIRGYYAVIDSSRLGYSSFRVYVKFQHTNPAIETRIADFLQHERQVWWLGQLEGSWDIGFLVWVKSIYEFRTLWLKFLLEFRKYVQRSEFSVYAKLRHYRLDYILSDEPRRSRSAEVVGEGPQVGIDGRDRQILRILARNGRMPVIEIASRTGLTPAMVKYRLKNLLSNGVIQNFRPIIAAEKLGYSLFKVDFQLEDMVKRAKLLEYLEGMPNLVYIDETVGGGDLEAEFHVRDPQQFKQLMGKIKRQFSKIIRSYDYMVYSEVRKYLYFPED